MAFERETRGKKRFWLDDWADNQKLAIAATLTREDWKVTIDPHKNLAMRLFATMAYRVGLKTEKTSQVSSLVLMETKGDGNCLFRALSTFIYGCQSQHHCLRKKLVRHLSQHLPNLMMHRLLGKEMYKL